MRRKRRTKEKWDKKKQKEKRKQIWEGCPSGNHLGPSCRGHAQILCLMYTIFPQMTLIHNFLQLKMYVVFPLPLILSPVWQVGPWLITSWCGAHGGGWGEGRGQGAGLTGEEGAALEVIGTHVGKGAAAGEQPDHRGPGGAARAAARGDWPRGERVCTQAGIPATDSSVLRVSGTRRLAVREVRSYCGNGEE